MACLASPFELAELIKTKLAGEITTASVNVGGANANVILTERPAIFVSPSGTNVIPWGLDGISVSVGGTEAGGVGIIASKYITGAIGIICVDETGKGSYDLAKQVFDKFIDTNTLAGLWGVSSVDIGEITATTLMNNNKDYQTMITVKWGLLARYKK